MLDGWAIKGPQGCLIWCVSSTRNGAVAEAMWSFDSACYHDGYPIHPPRQLSANQRSAWAKYRRKGYRAVRVQVVETDA